MPHRSLRVRTRALVRHFTIPPMPRIGEPRTPTVAGGGGAGRRVGRRERAAS